MLKKLMLIVCFCCLLWGCAAAPTFETLGDVLHDQPAIMKTAAVDIPADAQSLATEKGTAWLCGDYYLEMQTVYAEDLNVTVQAMSGFLPADLTVMTASHGDLDRYEWVWTAMSEEGEMLCRAVVLDDGSYHYCLTAMGPAALGNSLTEQWNEIFGSFSAA